MSVFLLVHSPDFLLVMILFSTRGVLLSVLLWTISLLLMLLLLPLMLVSSMMLPISVLLLSLDFLCLILLFLLLISFLVEFFCYFLCIFYRRLYLLDDCFDHMHKKLPSYFIDFLHYGPTFATLINCRPKIYKEQRNHHGNE